jgi:hypothetical protein
MHANAINLCSSLAIMLLFNVSHLHIDLVRWWTCIICACLLSCQGVRKFRHSCQCTSDGIRGSRCFKSSLSWNTQSCVEVTALLWVDCSLIIGSFLHDALSGLHFSIEWTARMRWRPFWGHMLRVFLRETRRFGEPDVFENRHPRKRSVPGGRFQEATIQIS